MAITNCSRIHRRSQGLCVGVHIIRWDRRRARSARLKRRSGGGAPGESPGSEAPGGGPGANPRMLDNFQKLNIDLHNFCIIFEVVSF